jgi:hypothetical protein
VMKYSQPHYFLTHSTHYNGVAIIHDCQFHCV